MKRFMNKKYLMILAAVMLLAAMVIPCERTYASSVVKIKASYKMNESQSTQRMILKGVDKNGKAVWTYKTKYVAMTELENNQYFVKGGRVYVFSGGNLTVLAKQTGKKQWSKNFGGASVSLAVDGNGDIYACGYYGPLLTKFSSKGDKIFEIADTQEYYWPYKIKLYENKVRVYIDSYDENHETADGKEHYVEYKKDGTLIGAK